MNPINHIKTRIAVLSVCLAAIVPAVQAQLNIPNADGSDGALIVSNSLTIDLRQAGTGSWTTNSANPGFGTYDPTQWAVVFKYSNVVISNGATLTFTNHPTHAPVVWLVQGNVTIIGNLSLDGQSGTGVGPALPEPGPGGFRGGNGGFSGWTGQGSGFGPGGGTFAYTGTGGKFSTAYGNAQVLPLIGGSGGGGGGSGGGAGGGAILIAASGTITINGSCHAQGGNGGSNGGGGSGGGIRLVASQITGTGTILAQGGPWYSSAGGVGVIRLESTNTTFTFGPSAITPVPTTLALTTGAIPTIFTNASSATIIGIVSAGLTNQPPSDPQAAFDVGGNDDVRIVTTNLVTIQVQTMNFPTNGFVEVYVKPLSGYNNAGNKVRYNAVFDGGNFSLANWHVTTDLPYPMHTILQARAYY